MKYGGLKNSIPQETWESLLNTADHDFISALVLWYGGISPGSTYAWMLPHAIEKYLKSYLLKYHHVKKQDLKKFGKNGHELKDIWSKYKSVTVTTTSKPKLNAVFDEIINDLDTIKPGLRYSGYIEFSSDKLLYYFIVLSCLLRYLIIGKEKYRSTLYGLDDQHFLPMNHNPMREGYGKTIIHKMLHISLEHAGSFTNMGFVNQMDFNELSISNTAIFDKLSNCPICNNSSTDTLSMIDFYRTLNPKHLT